MVRICKEENFHHKQGYEILATMMKGSEEQRKMAQDAVNRFWWPSLMMFGPTDKDSPNSGDLLNWKVKLHSNDELRQRFIDRTVPQAEHIGLTLPDSKLKWNEEKQQSRAGDLTRNISATAPGKGDRAASICALVRHGRASRRNSINGSP
jgi:ring-1,2-phenylacetyl-CoA epoxidase subunit PaaA